VQIQGDVSNESSAAELEPSNAIILNLFRGLPVNRVSLGSVESPHQKSFAGTKKVICQLGFASLNVSDPVATCVCGSNERRQLACM